MKSNSKILSQTQIQTSEPDPAGDSIAPQTEIRQNENRRILIVEDETEIIKVYNDILSPKSNVVKLKSSRSQKMTPHNEEEFLDQFEVTTVSNGEKALELVKESVEQKKPFTMGFFDVLLGTGIDGIETVRQIHQIDSEMYAILVTAYQDRHVNSIQTIFGREYQDRWDYLNKPFSEGEILQKARNMVSMWNIRRQKDQDQSKIDDLQQKITENERLLTVAAVARGVGHEFGNILLQIMGRADLAREGAESEMKKALETILTASEHAAKVLHRFKDLASPTEKLVSLHKMSILEPIRDTLLLMDHELKRRQIKTVVVFEDLPEIMGNRTGLVQVFMNLTINALHAMHEHGGHIEYRGKLVGDNIEIKVRDTGSGIPGAHIESIFKTFFTTKGENGTGIGLSICKEVVEITHGGKLTAGNHRDGGAEFCISLPVNREGENS